MDLAQNSDKIWPPPIPTIGEHIPICGDRQPLVCRTLTEAFLIIHKGQLNVIALTKFGDDLITNSQFLIAVSDTAFDF